MAESTKTTNNLTKITGLWKNKDTNGNEYFNGYLNPSVQILIFENKNKRPDKNDPDFNMFFTEGKKVEKEEEKVIE